MSTWSMPLADPPSDGRRRELWLQHVAGFILMHDVRTAALKGAPSTPEAAVDAAMAELMGVIDGVTGAMHNETWEVRLRMHVELIRRSDESDETELDLDLYHGNGMGMGFAGWIEEGDYGTNPILKG